MTDIVDGDDEEATCPICLMVPTAPTHALLWAHYALWLLSEHVVHALADDDVPLCPLCRRAIEM